ncbi:SMI1/KNR4 family protein [Paenibacillus naphthalenovorans]|uniref:Uncharacterized protein n=1 Tax=Paenibacillus naphthalenovorans TaxID=162209 RepID=A0A0U2UGS7_9BACL|nr:SMI1/KNR4 family protein [Paenibacillus naphthalenovorans]ALS25256.1 hypothetical protein IJ22_49940 [Paenibacillus naphthalenovorans]
MRSVLSGFSKQVRFHWFLDESERLVLRKNARTYQSDNENVPEFKERSIYSGGYLDCGLWDLDQLTALEQLREDLDYLDENGCRTHWADSLLFCSHGNGSYFGIDQTSGEVIYLSMDGIMHGWRLGYDLRLLCIIGFMSAVPVIGGKISCCSLPLTHRISITPAIMLCS